MSDEIDALEALTRHPGWARLTEHARAEWAVREFTARRNALGDTDDKRALDKLRQITAAQEAVEWVLTWPSQEIAKLRRQEASPVEDVPYRKLSIPAMAGMGRRGSL